MHICSLCILLLVPLGSERELANWQQQEVGKAAQAAKANEEGEMERKKLQQDILKLQQDIQTGMLIWAYMLT